MRHNTDIILVSEVNKKVDRYVDLLLDVIDNEEKLLDYKDSISTPSLKRNRGYLNKVKVIIYNNDLVIDEDDIETIDSDFMFTELNFYNKTKPEVLTQSMINKRLDFINLKVLSLRKILDKHNKEIRIM